MQAADRAKVQIQVLGIELEALGDLADRLFQLHQGNADVLDFLRRQGLFFKTPDGLPFHQLANELDQAEHELDDRALDIFGIGIPSQRLPSLRTTDVAPRASGAFLYPLPLAPYPFLLPGPGPLFHAVLRFRVVVVVDGPPITFLISLIRSWGRQGLVMTTSHPALLALSECPAIA